MSDIHSLRPPRDFRARTPPIQTQSPYFVTASNGRGVITPRPLKTEATSIFEGRYPVKWIGSTRIVNEELPKHTVPQKWPLQVLFELLFDTA